MLEPSSLLVQKSSIWIERGRKTNLQRPFVGISRDGIWGGE